jgi:hypothetical protein
MPYEFASENDRSTAGSSRIVKPMGNIVQFQAYIFSGLVTIRTLATQIPLPSVEVLLDEEGHR